MNEKSVKQIKNKNNKILLELAISINKTLYDTNKITYTTYKQAENTLLIKMKS